MHHTPKHAYKAGYRNGKRWMNHWYPGGPDGGTPEKDLIKSEWLRGFDNGLRNNTSLKLTDVLKSCESVI